MGQLNPLADGNHEHFRQWGTVQHRSVSLVQLSTEIVRVCGTSRTFHVGWTCNDQPCQVCWRLLKSALWIGQGVPAVSRKERTTRSLSNTFEGIFGHPSPEGHRTGTM